MGNLMQGRSTTDISDQTGRGRVEEVYVTGNATHVTDKGFIPSSYSADLTMNGTGQAVAVATGARKIRVVNRGATTEAIRVAFGISSADAILNLGIAAGAATTGYYIPAPADNSYGSVADLGIPTLATHYAVANAVSLDVQVVSITQGI